MKHDKTLRLIVLLLGLVFLATNVQAQEYGDVVYNRFNIHYYTNENRRTHEIEKIASYANYVDPLTTGHGIVPYNTPMVVGKWGRRGFKLTTQDGKHEIFFEYRAANMGGMSQPEYMKLIFSPEKVSHADLNAIDRKGIKKGEAMVGMTKTGVKVALGYPAKHRTPSLDENVWWYWKDRFRTMAVEFKEGKVVRVRE